MKKLNIKHEDLNTFGLIVLLVLVIFLFKKKNNTQQPIEESQNPTPEEPINNYVLKIPKKPLTINNKLSVVCPTLRKGYG